MLVKNIWKLVMKTSTFTFTLLTLLRYSTSDVFNYPLIKDYIEWNNIKATLFLTCGRPDWNDLNHIEANLKINDIWMNHWDMSSVDNVSNFNYNNFFVRSSYRFCVVVNLECNETQSVLNEISKRTMFHYERHWLIFGRSTEEMFNILSMEYINVDAEIAVVVPVVENEYEINDIYNPSCKRHGSFRMGKIGCWLQNGGLKMNETHTKFDRRKNLEGVTFLSAITIPKLPPHKTFGEHINSDEYLYMDNMSKSNYRVFQILMEMLNFKMFISRASIWGALTSNGSWSGVVGLLNRSEIDISISSLRWEGDRYGVFDQTTNSFYVQILFIFRHPKTVDATNVFLSPFDWVVWSLIVAIVIITTVFIRNFFLLENKLNITNAKLIELKEHESYNNSFIMIFGIIIQQGYDGNPLFISSRIFTFTILMLALVIYQFYGSFIVGSLLTETPKTIKTMKQLLNSRMDFAMDPFPYIQDTFVHIREESAVEMYNKILAQPQPFLPLFTGLNLVKTGTLAYNTDGIYAYAILKTILTDAEICELQEVKYVQKIPTGPGLPKKSPLRELIKIGIRKLHETGVIAHVWKTWISHMPKCARSDVDVVPVDMVHFSSALFAFGFGLQVSVAILIIERCLHHSKSTSKEIEKD